MNVTIFGSSTVEVESAAYKQAYMLGKLLGRLGIHLVSGGYGGIMEAASKGVSEMGGSSTGVINEEFKSWKQENKWVSKVVRSPEFCHRTRLMIDSSDIIIVLDGNIGTFFEMLGVWNLIDCKILEKEIPIIIMGKSIAKFVNFVADVSNRDLNASSFEFCNSLEEVETFLVRVRGSGID